MALANRSLWELRSRQSTLAAFTAARPDMSSEQEGLLMGVAPQQRPSLRASAARYTNFSKRDRIPPTHQDWLAWVCSRRGVESVAEDLFPRLPLPVRSVALLALLASEANGDVYLVGRDPWTGMLCGLPAPTHRVIVEPQRLRLYCFVSEHPLILSGAWRSIKVWSLRWQRWPSCPHACQGQSSSPSAPCSTPNRRLCAPHELWRRRVLLQHIRSLGRSLPVLLLGHVGIGFPKRLKRRHAMTFIRTLESMKGSADRSGEEMFPHEACPDVSDAPVAPPISLGSAALVTPPSEITEFVTMLTTLGWEAEAIPARSYSAGWVPSVSANRPPRMPLPPHPPNGVTSALDEWWIAARPHVRASASSASSANEDWDILSATTWAQRLHSPNAHHPRRYQTPHVF